MQRGFHLAMEALVALLFIGAISVAILSVRGKGESYLDELYILQKEHDLFRAWIREKNLSPGQMAMDVNFLFPGSGWELEVNGEIISNGKRTGKAISADYLYITGGSESSVRLRIFH